MPTTGIIEYPFDLDSIIFRYVLFYLTNKIMIRCFIPSGKAESSRMLGLSVNELIHTIVRMEKIHDFDKHLFCKLDQVKIVRHKCFCYSVLSLTGIAMQPSLTHCYVFVCTNLLSVTAIVMVVTNLGWYMTMGPPIRCRGINMLVLCHLLSALKYQVMEGRRRQ